MSSKNIYYIFDQQFGNFKLFRKLIKIEISFKKKEDKEDLFTDTIIGKEFNQRYLTEKFLGKGAYGFVYSVLDSNQKTM